MAEGFEEGIAVARQVARERDELRLWMRASEVEADALRRALVEIAGARRGQLLRRRAAKVAREGLNAAHRARAEYVNAAAGTPE